MARKQIQPQNIRARQQRRKRLPATEFLIIVLFIAVIATIAFRPWEKFQKVVTSETTTAAAEDKKNLRGTPGKSGFNMDWLLYLTGSLIFVFLVFFVYTSKTSLTFHSGIKDDWDKWEDVGFLERARIIVEIQRGHLAYWFELFKIRIHNMLSRNGLIKSDPIILFGFEKKLMMEKAYGKKVDALVKYRL